MRGSFFGFNVALRGLFTSQRNLDIVGHNISNATTPGYSRQVSVQQASRPLSAFDGTGMIGTGSDIITVQRIRDEYLDFKYWSEALEYGEWNVKEQGLADIEAAFNELSESGITTTLDEFFASLQELSKDPSSSAIRSLVKQRGVVIAKQLNNLAAQFEKLQSDINYNIKIKVDEINSLADQIKRINDQIYRAEIEGDTANDLRDQRSVLIDKLSRIVNIEVNEVLVGRLPNGKEDKKLVVSVAGKVLIDYHGTNKIKVVARGAGDKININEEIDGLFDIRWEDGSVFTLRGGEMRGYFDVRDGNEGIDEGNGASPIFKGIPYYMRQLNTFARTFAEAFNEGFNDGQQRNGHADGYDLHGNTGVRFFTIDGTDPGAILPPGYYDGLKAKNIAVNISIVEDINKIAAAGSPEESGNGDNIVSLLKIRHFDSLFNEGAPEDFMKSVISTMGIDSQQAQRICDTQDNIVKQIERRRESMSGVSLDEEMSNMVKYQHSYNAAAKMISTMAEIYDVLINRLGNI